jgi:hypothetical protein
MPASPLQSTHSLPQKRSSKNWMKKNSFDKYLIITF